MPRQGHVAKVAQSATGTWQEHATSAFWWGQRPFSNKNIFVGMYFKFFFYRDENQNWPKLQGRLSYLNHVLLSIIRC